jgi:hypothetical protein
VRWPATWTQNGRGGSGLKGSLTRLLTWSSTPEPLLPPPTAAHIPTLALSIAPLSRSSISRIEAHEEKGDYETAARLQREFLSAERPTPKPLTLVPFSPISHGADLYSDLRLYESYRIRLNAYRYYAVSGHQW